jgi:hypothetical protein
LRRRRTTIMNETTKASTTSTATKIFVNLPVKDLSRSKDFFAKLGYSFNYDAFDLKARIGWICWLRNSKLDRRIQRN